MFAVHYRNRDIQSYCIMQVFIFPAKCENKPRFTLMQLLHAYLDREKLPQVYMQHFGTPETVILRSYSLCLKLTCRNLIDSPSTKIYLVCVNEITPEYVQRMRRQL